jgi:hypothetical protein
MTIAQLSHVTEMACRIWLAPTTPEDERRRQETRGVWPRLLELT